jgi:hypothetical protein
VNGAKNIFNLIKLLVERKEEKKGIHMDVVIDYYAE